MGWDLFICKFSQAYEAMATIPDKERCLPLETCDEVRKAITKAFPETDWSDSRWGIYDAAFGAIEFNLGDDEPAEGILVHIRSDRSVLPAIAQLCRHSGWQLLDIASGLFIERSPDVQGGSMDHCLTSGYQMPDFGTA